MAKNRRWLAWGLVGAGDIARKRVVTAIKGLAPRAKLLGVASRRRAPAEELAHEHGIPRVLEDWRALVADPDIDAVYVATPVHLHAEITIAAARAGKHVLCEKPMALTHRECRAMIRAARSAHVRLGIAYYRRFYPVVVRMKELLENGAIGTPVLAEVLVAARFDAVGPAAPRRWLLDGARSGGGPMMDFGCHRLDLLLHLLGDVRQSTAVLRNLEFHNRSVEDHATALLAFAGGATGHITASHCLAASQDRFSIRGTAGSLMVENLASGTLEVRSRSTMPVRYDLPSDANVHLPLVADFNRAVLTRREPLVTGEEGARTSRLLDDIYGRARALARRGGRSGARTR